MKNIICIVVDSYCYNNIKNRIGEKYVTPFLNKLLEKSTYFEKIYSLAPYTEASQVTILGNERTLENGGYLLGNKECKKTIFELYKENGYYTIFSYSPYIYSKSYLRGVDKFYYTRLYSIEPLFLYRLNYYKEKRKKNTLKKEEEKICHILLEEAFETWILQCCCILESKSEANLIEDTIEDKEFVLEIFQKLLLENKNFLENKSKYLEEIFNNFENHTLRILCIKYNENRKNFPMEKKIKKKYYKKLYEYQNKYSKIIRKKNIEKKYLLKNILNHPKGIYEGIKEFKALLIAYKRRYFNNDLLKYLNRTKNDNVEVSLDKVFRGMRKDILEYDRKEIPFLAYIHIQDFHLPSMFHTYDTYSFDEIQNEFESSFKLLDELDKNYDRNIIADLSAHYIDLKLEKIYLDLKKFLKQDFIFVITADHGYPLYDNPPRAFIYNQVYTEAFHIPFIIYDSKLGISSKKTSLCSNLDGFKTMFEKSGINYKKEASSEKDEEYILCEYGGPGCPAIYEKNIWYTLITSKLNISFECSLLNDLEIKDIKSVFDLEKDPQQKYNIVKQVIKSKEIKKYIKIVNERHKFLRNKFMGQNYFNKILENNKKLK